ncbi:hypothetical protein HKBW3S06_00181, partial [Candidatus Hakubella thermalkaliphila]
MLEGWGFYSEGLASISAVLKQNKHNVSLLHLIKDISKEEFLLKIEKEKPDLIGFSFATTTFYRLSNYVKWIKMKFNIPIICGGYHPTLAPEEVLNIKEVDMVCIGEGEYPMLELCNKIEKKENYEYIDSLYVKTKDGIIKNKIRPLIENLDTLPFPDFGLFNFNNLIASKINTATIMISRGCLYNCSYCANHATRKLYPNSNKYTRTRSPENAIEYIKILLQHCGNEKITIKYIGFLDNNLSWPKEWSIKFLNLYLQEIHLPFSCNLRADTIDKELCGLLKKAGCFRVHIGVESGNKEIRFSILKRSMPDNVIKKAFDLFKNAKISSLAYNMVGLPYETPKAALDTIKLNALIKPTRSLAAIFCPFPRTEAYNISLNAGFIKEPVDYSKEIVLKNKSFSEDQIYFFSLYFRFITQLYKIIFVFPGFIKIQAEKFFDSFFCWDKIPYKFLNKIMRFYKRSKDSLKNKIRNKNPKLYLFLRNSF